MDLKQTTRYSKGEMELIQNTFKGEGEAVLYSIRDVLLGFRDTVWLKDDVLAVVKKTLLPVLDPEIPMGQQADFYIGLSKITEIPPEVAYLHIQARDKAFDYLTDRFNLLEGKEGGKIKLESLKTRENKSDEERFVDMVAYTFLTNAYIESCLIQLKNLANQTEETGEEKKKKAEANSSK